MGLGLAHSAFVRTNAMLALIGIFKFSAKFFCKAFLSGRLDIDWGILGVI